METIFDWMWPAELTHTPDSLELARRCFCGGDFRGALKRLLSAEGTIMSGEDRDRQNGWMRTVSYVFAALGHREDAHEWLSRSYTHALRNRQSGTVGAVALLQVQVLECTGHLCRAINLTEGFLENFTDAKRMLIRPWLLLQRGALFTRTWQHYDAASCLDSVLVEGQPNVSEHCKALASAYRGELEWWRFVRHHPELPGPCADIQPFVDRRVSFPAIAESAARYWTRAGETMPGSGYLHRLCAAANARMRLLRTPCATSLRVLEDAWRWQHRAGLEYDEFATRLSIGVSCLLHGENRTARMWLQPTANHAMVHPGVALDQDALYFGSIAAERIGDSSEARRFYECFCNRRRMHGQEARRLRERGEKRALFAIRSSDAPAAQPRRVRQVRRLRLNAEGARVSNATVVVKHLTSYVKNHAGTAICVGDLVKAAGCSRRSIEYAFREQTGLTPKVFITRANLELVRQAMELRPHMSEGDLMDLARQTGFSSDRAFVRAFHGHFGVPPHPVPKDLTPILSAPIEEGEVPVETARLVPSRCA